MNDEKQKMSVDLGVGIGESQSVITMVEVTDGQGVVVKGTATVEEGHCHAREDCIHCDHWWDGDGCCSCGAPAMTQEEMIEQGMIISVESPEEVPVLIEAKLTIGGEEGDS